MARVTSGYRDTEGTLQGAKERAYAEQRSTDTLGLDQVRPSRDIDAFLEADSEQAMRLTSMLRRLEDLADRVCGAIPTAANASGAGGPPMPPGIMAAIGDLHQTRNQINERASDALSRIERVL